MNTKFLLIIAVLLLNVANCSTSEVEVNEPFSVLFERFHDGLLQPDATDSVLQSVRTDPNIEDYLQNYLDHPEMRLPRMSDRRRSEFADRLAERKRDLNRVVQQIEAIRNTNDEDGFNHDAGEYGPLVEDDLVRLQRTTDEYNRKMRVLEQFLDYFTLTGYFLTRY